MEPCTNRTRFSNPAIMILAAWLLCMVELPAQEVTPWDATNQVSQNHYQSYQLAIQNMGLGLYGGPSYNQGYRNRFNSNGSATASLGFQEATMYLTNQFSAMGLDISYQSDYMNIVAELVGRDTPDRIFIISGHYDHPENDFEAPGGDDNASGTASVLEAARVLSQFNFRSTIRFISWGGEEGWMKGSWDYVRNVVQANNENIVGMLNMDMILRPGWDSDPSAEIDLDLSTGTSPECQAWAYKFMDAGATYSPSLVFDSRNPQVEDWYPSDQGPFIQEGYPGLMIAENTAREIWYQGTNAYYHTAGDASDRAANDPNNGSGIVYDYAFATKVVRTAVGMLAEEAEMISQPSADFDVDGNVDGADFLAWQVGFGIASVATLADGDSDFDGDVDHADLLVWQQQFGASSSSLNSAAVPEPACILLLWMSCGIASFSLSIRYLRSMALIRFPARTPTGMPAPEPGKD